MITTIGVFKTHMEAESTLHELRDFGIDESDLSYLYINNEGNIKDGEEGSKMGDGTISGATTGAIIGGIAGLVIANGILPGLGTLIVAGPLAAALGFTGIAATAVAGAATGAVAGGLIGALSHMGISEDDVHIYEDYVRRGDILVIARATEKSTKDIFMKNGASSVRNYTVE